MTRFTGVKPATWVNAFDQLGIVHRVTNHISNGVMLCVTRCGLVEPSKALTPTNQAENCMTCMVREIRRAEA